MKLSLTKAEMLVRRRLAGGFEPLRADCTVEDTAGTDIDALLLLQLRDRYLELLDTADAALLAPDEVSALTSLTSYVDGGALLEPPPSCRRVLSVWLDGWTREASVLPAGELERVMALQRNPFTASDSRTPLAVALPGGRVAAWPGARKSLSVIAVCDDGPDIYKFDERALALLCESQFNPVL